MKPKIGKDLILIKNNEAIDNKIDICNILNDTFVQVGSKLNECKTEPPLIFDIPDRHIDIPLCLGRVTPQEVVLTAKALKNKTSFGLDGVSNKLIKACIHNISYPLAEIATASFQQGQFPSSLKKVAVTPIFKGGDSGSVDSYRPITKVSSFSKLFEILFLNRLKPFLVINNILSPKQFGFVQGRSTGDAISSFISAVMDGLEARQRTIGVMMDLSKAFDCVSHTQLLDGLRQLGLNFDALRWLSSYLSQREQCVELDGHRSDWNQISFGVPQGSVLGPILYNLYINNISAAIPHRNMVLYADDIAMTFSDASMENIEIDCHIITTQLYQFLNNLNLHLNLEKTTYLNFSKYKNNVSPTIMVDSSELSQAISVKYLGIYIDDNLSWQTHINHICKQLSSTIFLLNQLAKYRHVHLLKIVYFALFESRMRYGLLVWGSATLSLLRRVFVLQKRAVRVLAGLRRGVSCRDSFRELQLLTFPSLYIFEVIIHARFSSFGALNGTAIHEHNTRARIDLRRTRHRSARAASLPVNAGARFFSKLPAVLKEINNQNHLKKN